MPANGLRVNHYDFMALQVWVVTNTKTLIIIIPYWLVAPGWGVNNAVRG